LMTQSDNITEILDFVRSRLRARLLDVKPSKCLFFSNREDDSTPMIDDTPITRVDSLYFLGYLLTREKEPLNTVDDKVHKVIDDLKTLSGRISPHHIFRALRSVLLPRLTHLLRAQQWMPDRMGALDKELCASIRNALSIDESVDDSILSLPPDMGGLGLPLLQPTRPSLMSGAASVLLHSDTLRNPLLSLIHHNDNCGPAIIPLLQEIHNACIALFKVADNTPLQASDTLVSSGTSSLGGYMFDFSVPVDSPTHLSPAEEEILDFLEWAEEQEADDTTGYTPCLTFENPLSSIFTKPGVKKYKHQLHEASFNSLVLSLRNTIVTAHEADILIDPVHINQDTDDLLRTRAQGTRASLQLLSLIAASDPSNIFSSLLKTVFGRLLNAPSFRMLLADRYGYLCPGISVTEKCPHCDSQLDFVSSTNHSRVCRRIRSNITGRHDDIRSLSAAWLEEVLGLPITQEDTHFLRHLNTRTQRADIVAHAFGTSDWSRNLVFDARITEVVSTNIILDFTRKIVAIGNSVTAIVELGRGIIHACLTNKESYKRSEYAPHPPPGSEIDPRYSFDFYPMIFSSTGVVGESFQEFLALVQRHHSSRCIEELKVVLARSLAYGNALNRQAYELRCSGHATSETIYNHRLLFPFTHRSCASLSIDQLLMLFPYRSRDYEPL
ncbi:hypothetical protein ADUPG1_006141, partial [Aduncisulcus paluster]